MDYKKKLMKFRDLWQLSVKHRIGNGQATFLWLDNWQPKGPLYKLFDKVSSVIENGIWHWPRPRNNIIQQIQPSTPASLISLGPWGP